MTSRSMECWLFSQTPVLTPVLLSRIGQLNFEYLQLLLEVPESVPCTHAEALPAPVRPRPLV